MKTFKNTVATKDNRITTVHFAQGETKPSNEDFGNWIECDEMELEFSGLEHLYTIAGVRYFGRL